jgi:hypothetical protein
MKGRLATISVSLLVGIMIGIFMSPSLWKGIGKAMTEQQAAKQEIITVAKTAMAGKKVCLTSEDEYASAAAQMLVTLGASYAPKQEADFLISVKTEKRIGFKDLDFRDHSGNLLHRVFVSEKELAENEACMFAWGLAFGKQSVQ